MKSNFKKIFEKQGYRFIGNNSAIKICEWTRKSLIDKGECFKEKFYGIKSHRCCQISPTFNCQNRCVHCWREIELSSDFDKIDSPEEIISNSIKFQRKLLLGFKGNEKVNMKKYLESQDPQQFAISLIGEPTLYSKLGELINELRKRGKTTFVVTNGLQPEVLKKLNEEKQLPTQLYVSLNANNKEMYEKWHRSSEKNAWKKFNETISLFPKLKTRKVIRITLVRGMNDGIDNMKEFAGLIKKAKPDFIEIKSFMSVGGARKRLGYEKMIPHKEIKEYAKAFAKQIGNKYKVLAEHEISRVVLIGKDKKRMKIQKNEI